MRKPLVRLVRINGLQYNPNRDPQAYRRVAGERFRIQALLEGAGEASCALVDERGVALDAARIARPGTYSAELRFERPGSRVVTLTVDAGDERYAQNLRLDVLAHAWEG